MASSLNNLGLLLRDKGDYAEVQPLLERALAIDEKALVLYHPATKNVRANLQTLIGKQSEKQMKK